MQDIIYLIPTRHSIQRSGERGMKIPPSLDLSEAKIISSDNNGHLKLKIKSKVYVLAQWCGNTYELITCYK